MYFFYCDLSVQLFGKLLGHFIYNSSLNLRELEDESPYDEKAAEQGFMAQKTGSGWQMTRMFWSQEEPTHLEEEGREVFFAKTVNTVVKALWGTSTEDILAPARDFAAKNGLTVADEVYGFWVFTDYSQPSPEDYIMLWVPVK